MYVFKTLWGKLPLYYTTNGTTHNLYKGDPQAITILYIYINFFERL